jgi:hypothetical protein
MAPTLRRCCSHLGTLVHGRPPLQIVCGNRAGALTILLDEQQRWEAPEQLQGEERPHFIARTLREVQDILQKAVELVPPSAAPQPLM